MKKILFASAILIAQAAPAFAEAVTVPVGTPTVVISPIVSNPNEPIPFGAGRTYQRVVNPGATTDGTAWCVRGTASTPGVRAAGSFPIAPYGNSLGMPSKEEFSSVGGGYVPQGALLCVSDGGSNGATAAKLTVETMP